jgi:hypothetical protein
LGVFLVVPAAGPAALRDDQASVTTVASIQTNPSLPASVTKTPEDDQWNIDFDNMMHRLWKWWACAVSPPGALPADEMDRMRECYGLNGVPPSLSPSEEDELNRDIDDLIHQTDKAPTSMNQATVAAFRTMLFDILTKIN